ncbi:MAG TPA: phenylalanine--tRNA ligase beta subunit-related protein [Candidatus Dormibacteraeota bacterium]|nr:phenylalanine--tRNA ligase beta subunit-related protein [Candidatus Dormibacteraeota bacterium]
MILATEIDVAVSVLEVHELEVTGPRSDFDAEVADAEAAVRAGRVGDPGPARALYRRFGVDPTRHRPSSEALLRRVRRGDPLPRVNSLVDVGNVVSVCLQVPVGLYDLTCVQGSLRARLGREGESYAGIGKEDVNVAGRICIADDAGACGSPSADSARTMITAETQRAAWIFFLPVSERDLRRTYELVARYGRGLVRLGEAA